MPHFPEEAQKAANLARLYNKTGGYLKRPNAKAGMIHYINAQRSIPESEYKKSILSLMRQMRVEAAFETIEQSIELENLKKTVDNRKAALAIFIVEEPKIAEPLIVAPESRWAMVNISSLKTNAPNEAFVKTRTEKEIVRATLYLSGACNSQYQDSIMRGIKTPDGLDAIDTALAPVDVIGRTRDYLPSFDITPNMMTTYSVACQEGWAPKPTNEVQKAIWDKVHAPPEKPMKITYDKDKQKPVVK